MRISNTQLGGLRDEARARRRREDLLGLRSLGLQVEEDTSDGSFLVRDAAGGTARVEARGPLTRVTTAEGRVLELEQHASGRARRLRDPAGHEVLFERDDHGYLTAIDRGNGSRFGFALTKDWKPARVTYPDGTTAATE